MSVMRYDVNDEYEQNLNLYLVIQAFILDIGDR